MRTILHMSDLHFGRTDPVVVQAIQGIARSLKPDLVVVSGDLTQRARTREFVAARRFLEGFAAPKVVVPGNHDVPLFNLAARFLRPLHNFRKHIAGDIQPVYVDEELVVVGVNTARSLTWKDGRINREQVREVQTSFGRAGSGHIRVLVSHHPFDLPAGLGQDDVVGRATMAIAGWRACAPDILLAGHFHAQGTGTTAGRHEQSPAAVVVQAGTATSTRVRGEKNSFNLVLTHPGRIEVQRHEWDSGASAFALHTRAAFVKADGGWIRGEPV